jgi:hypothetical protein
VSSICCGLADCRVDDADEAGALCRQLQILNRPTKELAGVSVGLPGAAVAGLSRLPLDLSRWQLRRSA